MWCRAKRFAGRGGLLDDSRTRSFTTEVLLFSWCLRAFVLYGSCGIFYSFNSWTPEAVVIGSLCFSRWQRLWAMALSRGERAVFLQILALSPGERVSVG